MNATQIKICSNKDCERSLLEINPTYGIVDKNVMFCSRACRATVTGEHVMLHPAPAPVEAQAPVDTPLNKVRTLTGKGAKVPLVKPTAPKASSDAPWRNMEGRIHILRTDQKYTGIRLQVWNLIKEGMKVKELYAKCEKAGLECSGNLRTIIKVYNCVEVK